jgi:AcrR family transcriptional regulator
MYIEQVLKASAQGSATRERILDAAFATLRREGFNRTSARAIARHGGFNQALIFYHFGSVTDLLLAALDRVAEERRRRYEAALGPLTTPLELATQARALFAEDVDSGHSTVLAELFAASSGSPHLREQMVARMQPWLEFTERLIERFTAGSPLEALIDARAAAGSILALYLGIDLLIHLDGDHTRATAMFDAGDRLAATLAPLFGGDPA